MSSREDEPTGMTGPELDAVADQVRTWAKRGDVFAYFHLGREGAEPGRGPGADRQAEIGRTALRPFGRRRIQALPPAPL